MATANGEKEENRRGGEEGKEARTRSSVAWGGKRRRWIRTREREREREGEVKGGKEEKVV